MINVIKFKFCIVLALIMLSLNVMAQDEDNTGNLPVRSPFEAGTLIENPTIVNPLKGAIELNILHRFGLMDKGTTDLFGIYAASNIKMGINYGITDRIMIGIGTTKDNQLQDINWKVALIQQNRSGSKPVSISYYGNFVIDARDKSAFGVPEQYREIHRLSYFTEFLLARKFNEVLSLQLAPNFTYFNAVDTIFKNINVGFSLGGRAKIFSSSSIIFEYDQAVTKGGPNVEPNLSIGYEIGTATHAFQIFISNFRNIVPQYNYVYNENALGKFAFGFNITVRL